MTGENMPRETYKEARVRLLKELAARGWTVKPELKTPTAISTTIGPDLGFPDFKTKLYFHPQSVYMHDHSMHLDDIRGMNVESFLNSVVYWVQAQANNPDVYG
jgi:hypothetical protein